METFGETIKRLRTSRGITQEEFGDMLGTSKQVISRYEKSQRVPKISVVLKMADALQVPVSIILGDDGFTNWCKQVIAICFTTFMQTTLLYMGLLTMQNHALLGLGVMLAANEVPRIAERFGLETGTKPNVMSVVHTTSSAINLGRTIIRK